MLNIMYNIYKQPNVNIEETDKTCLLYDEGSNAMICDLFVTPLAICSPYTLVVFDTKQECLDFIASNGVINNFN